MSLSGLYRGPFRSGSDLQHEVRFDVDGPYPQMMASGSVLDGTTVKASWTAKLRQQRPHQIWTGRLLKRGKGPQFKATSVKISLAPPPPSAEPTLDVEFLGRRRRLAPSRCQWKSPYFHEVNFEFDHTADTRPTFVINTGAHPRRPRALPVEELTIANVFERAGFQVSRSGADVVPIRLAANAKWNLQELNDAMHNAWSRFAEEAQWGLWVFTTGLFEPDEPHHANDTNEEDEDAKCKRYAGLMFDYSGRVQRQGVAVFNNSYISDCPRGDSHSEAWIDRMRFFATCHEMGHAFNLAHSWQKSTYGHRWNPSQPNVRNAESFMNYPFDVPGGQSRFFSKFEYRFLDEELQFLRHAPSRFVEMGAARFTYEHGLEFPHRSVARPEFRLQVRASRRIPAFDFLEPITVELTLTNVSRQPKKVDPRKLESINLVIEVKRQGEPARRFRPIVRYDCQPSSKRLKPGESISASLFLSAGADRWYLDRPGRYTVRVALADAHDVAPAQLRLTIANPHGPSDERIAQDFFTDEVGRTLAVDGTRVMLGANATLMKILQDPDLKNRPVAIHAAIALACPEIDSSKRLQVDGSDLTIVTEPANPGEGFNRLRFALEEREADARETLGQIDYSQYLVWYRNRLAAQERRRNEMTPINRVMPRDTGRGIGNG